VIFVCCDGLKGLPDAIEATWPDANVQTCVVHLIRASVRYCSWKDRKKITAALRPIYTAPTVDAAADALDTFELQHGDRYGGIVALWRNSWERFIPFLAYPPIIRKIVYTTDEIVKPARDVLAPSGRRRARRPVRVVRQVPARHLGAA
jgi:putative transposase